jgi:hypothetical protein
MDTVRIGTQSEFYTTTPRGRGVSLSFAGYESGNAGPTGPKTPTNSKWPPKFLEDPTVTLSFEHDRPIDGKRESNATGAKLKSYTKKDVSTPTFKDIVSFLTADMKEQGIGYLHPLDQNTALEAFTSIQGQGSWHQMLAVWEDTYGERVHSRLAACVEDAHTKIADTSDPVEQTRWIKWLWNVVWHRELWSYFVTERQVTEKQYVAALTRTLPQDQCIVSDSAVLQTLLRGVDSDSSAVRHSCVTLLWGLWEKSRVFQTRFADELVTQLTKAMIKDVASNENDKEDGTEHVFLAGEEILDAGELTGGSSSGGGGDGGDAEDEEHSMRSARKKGGDKDRIVIPSRAAALVLCVVKSEHWQSVVLGGAECLERLVRCIEHHVQVGSRLLVQRLYIGTLLDLP